MIAPARSFFHLLSALWLVFYPSPVYTAHFTGFGLIQAETRVSIDLAVLSRPIELQPFNIFAIL